MLLEVQEHRAPQKARAQAATQLANELRWTTPEVETYPLLWGSEVLEFSKTHLIIGDPLFVTETVISEAIIVAPELSDEVVRLWRTYSAQIGLGLNASKEIREMSAGERVASCLLFAIAVAKVRELSQLRFLFDGTLQTLSQERLEAIRSLARAEAVHCEWWRREVSSIAEIGK